MTGHAEGFRKQEHRTGAAAAAVRRGMCRREGIEHVVAIETGVVSPVHSRPGGEIVPGMVLLKPGAERHLVVLDDEDDRQALDGGEVERLVDLASLGRSIAHPGQSHTSHAQLAKREAVPRDHRCQAAHHANRCDNAVGATADVQIASGIPRILRGQVALQHVGDAHPHLVAGTGIADHRAHHVTVGPLALERVHRPDRRRLLAGTQPRLRDHTLPDPTFERDIVETKAKQASVEREELLCGERLDRAAPLRVPLDRRLVTPRHFGVRRPVDIFRRIEGRVASQVSSPCPRRSDDSAGFARRTSARSAVSSTSSGRRSAASLKAARRSSASSSSTWYSCPARW